MQSLLKRDDAKSMNVMFTSVGRRVELLRAFRAAYERLDLAGAIVALDIDPIAPALQLADRPYIVPRIGSPSYIATVAAICEKERVDIVFPLIDPDIPVLAAHRAQIEASGAKLAVIPPAAVATTGDKWLTGEFFRSLDLDTPLSWLPGRREVSPAEFPLFIKPRDGSAAQFTFKLRNERELAFFADYVPNPIIQECLPGPEITSDVVCDLDGSVLAVVSRQRIEVRSGEVAKGVTIYDSTIIDACRRIAAALPAKGPITVQCMLKEGVPHFTEINARFGGGLPLAIAAGVNAPEMLLARAAGIDVSVPPLGCYRTGLYMSRYDDSTIITGADREAMASRRI